MTRMNLFEGLIAGLLITIGLLVGAAIMIELNTGLPARKAVEQWFGAE